MPESETVRCGCCSASVTPQVPEYYAEIESFRLMAERNESVPRRGSAKYHDAMERLRPEAQASYFQNHELYDRGHLWCPMCGNKLIT